MRQSMKKIIILFGLSLFLPPGLAFALTYDSSNYSPEYGCFDSDVSEFRRIPVENNEQLLEIMKTGNGECRDFAMLSIDLKTFKTLSERLNLRGSKIENVLLKANVRIIGFLEGTQIVDNYLGFYASLGGSADINTNFSMATEVPTQFTDIDNTAQVMDCLRSIETYISCYGDI